MVNAPRILALAGSTRRESYNKRLVQIAAAATRVAGADTTLIDLADYPMPLYDGDLEGEFGIPEHAMRLKRLMLEHTGILLACPEYNGSISAVLKNAIDWTSRKADDESNLQCFKGKIVSLMSASPGRLGGLRGLVHVRAILGGMGCIVLPDQVAVMGANKAFNENGTLQDESLQQNVERLGRGLVEVVQKLA